MKQNENVSSIGDFISLFCSVAILIAFLFMPWLEIFGFYVVSPKNSMICLKTNW